MADVMQFEGPGEARNEVAYWDEELKSAERLLKDWCADFQMINQRYSLKDADMHGNREVSTERSPYNVLWSNIQTMMPAIYSQQPKPVIKRRYRDPDNVGRLAAMVLERAIMSDMEANERNGFSFDDVMHKVTLDYLLGARGTAWMRYEVDLEGDADEQVLKSESTVADYVCYSDFLHAPKRTWEEVQRSGWVARATLFTRREGVNRFGEIFNHVPMSANEKKMDSGYDADGYDHMEVLKQAKVWEIWDSKTRQVTWLCRDYHASVLDRKPDILGLEGFFPCPRPAYGTLINNSLVPTPDFKQYEKHAKVMEDQSRRIDNLTSLLRLAGIYDSSMPNLARLLSRSSQENTLVAVDNFAALASKSGGGGNTLGNVVQYLPIDKIAEALLSLYDARERTKATIYEISGIADIMRGVVDPREKLGQSRIKSENAGARIEQRKMEMERFARDLLRRKAEIICEHYSPETIRGLSGFDQIPDVRKAVVMQGMDPNQIFMACYELLRNERTRGFRIEIETNSTVIMNDDMEKQRRVEFLTAMGNFLERAVPAIQQTPQLGPLLGQMMLFGVRGFRISREIESAFEEMFETMMLQPPEDPEADDGQEAAMEQEKAMIEGQMQQQKAQIDMQMTQVQSQAKLLEAQAKMEEIRLKAQANAEDMALKRELKMAELEVKQLDLENQRAKLSMEAEANQNKVMLDIAKGEIDHQRQLQQPGPGQLNRGG